MRKILSLLSLCSLAFVSCDIVEGPYTEGGSNPIDTTAKVRKVLLEDYTGHKCSNCPEAADIAEQVAHQFKGRVVLLGVHAGFFAEPGSAPYDTDFRTPEAEAWDQFFGISNAGNPNGMVNRADFPISDHVKNMNAWGSLVAQELSNSEADIWIDINTDYNSSNRLLTVNTNTEILSNLTEGPYHLVVVLREDSIIAAQKSVDGGGSVIDVLDYNHMHVLRSSLTSTWGDQLAPAGLSAGQSFENNYNITIDNNFKAEHLSVVAFVYDNSSKKVIQADYEYIQ